LKEGAVVAPGNRMTGDWVIPKPGLGALAKKSAPTIGNRILILRAGARLQVTTLTELPGFDVGT